MASSTTLVQCYCPCEIVVKIITHNFDLSLFLCFYKIHKETDDCCLSASKETDDCCLFANLSITKIWWSMLALNFISQGNEKVK